MSHYSFFHTVKSRRKKAKKKDRPSKKRYCSKRRCFSKRERERLVPQKKDSQDQSFFAEDDSLFFRNILFVYQYLFFKGLSFFFVFFSACHGRKKVHEKIMRNSNRNWNGNKKSIIFFPKYGPGSRYVFLC